MVKYKENPKLFKGPIYLIIAIIWLILGGYFLSTPPGVYRDLSGGSLEYFILLFWFCILLVLVLLGVIYIIQGIQIIFKKKSKPKK